MALWARVARWVRSVVGRGPIDRDLDAELNACLAMLAEEKVAAGIDPAEARRLARLEIGGVEQVKERVRDVRPAAWLDVVSRDVRFGVRQLAKAPAFSVASILVLALGVGANVAIFGVINLFLLQPRVGADRPGTLVALHVRDARNPDSYRSFSYVDLREIAREARVFTDLAAHRRIQVLLSSGEESRPVAAAEVTSSYFSTLGARLAAGRAFTPEEEQPGSGAAVAVINHETWQDLGGEQSVIGRTIFVNTHPFTIVGIAPRGFAGTLVAFGPRIWVPLGAHALVSEDIRDAGERGPSAEAGRRALSIVARLRPGVGIEAANAALATLPSQLDPPRSEAGAGEVVTANRLARTQDSDAPESDAGLVAPLGTLQGMSAILLFVASLNVANMQLARGTTRRKEIATRLALGAGRGRVVLQLLVEGLLLSAAGGVAGLVVGVWTLRIVASAFAPIVADSFAASLAPDVRVVLATAVFSLVSALVFAAGPSISLSRPDVLLHLRSSSGSDAPGRSWAGPRNLVVAFQVALSLALLATAGLFVRGALVAGRANPGYPVERQVIVRVGAPGSTAEQAREAFQDLVDRLRATPEVESASAASLVAFGSSHSTRQVRAWGTAVEGGRTGAMVEDYAVGAGYFRTLGLPVLSGREFTSVEERRGVGVMVVIVDEPLADALFAGEDPVGRAVEFPASGGRPAATYQIVGLVAGQRDRVDDAKPVAHVYRPIGSSVQAQTIVHVRLADSGARSPAEVMGRLRDVVRAAGPRVAMLDVSTFEDARDRVPTTWLIRAAGVMFGALGAVGLAMAVIGLYGVKAYLVARRSREIGIRMALGAAPREVIGMVLRDGSVMLGAGLVTGFVLALCAGFVVRKLLVGVRPLDPFSLLLAAAALAVAVAAASYVPARRATRIDPTVAMRSE